MTTVRCFQHAGASYPVKNCYGLAGNIFRYINRLSFNPCLYFYPKERTVLTASPSYDEATSDVIPRRLPPIQHQHVADMSGKID